MALVPSATWLDTISYYRAVCMTTDGGTYIYVLTRWDSSHPYRLLKINRSTMLAESSYILPDNASVSGNVYQIRYLNGFVYIPTWSDPMNIYKVNVSTMALDSKTTLTGQEGYCRGICTDGTYIFVAASICNPGEIYKIDPSTMGVVGTWVSGTGLRYLTRLYHDGTYLYVGTSTVSWKATVAQINPTTMADVAQWTEASGTYYHAYGVTGDGTFIYAVLDTNPFQIYKINPSGMSEVSHYTNSSCTNGRAITYNDEFVVGASRTYTPDVMYVVPATMALDDSYTGTGSDEYLDVAFDGDYTYALKNSTPGNVFRFGSIASPKSQAIIIP